MTPYRVLAGVPIFLMTIAGAFIAGRSHGADTVQAQWDLAKAGAAADARAKEQSFNQKLQEANHAAAQREAQLRADYAAVRDANRGLFNTVSTLRAGLSSTPADACRATADTALTVFSECAVEIGRLAEAADGHASDVQTLTDAWPK